MAKKKEKIKRRTLPDMFLDRLRVLGGEEQRLISNNAIREALGWNEDRYNRIKAQLVEQKLIVVGRGYGGSVGLAEAPGSQPRALTLFISYSHADEGLKNELIKHLSPLKRLKLVDAWHDRKLNAGDNIDQQISANLKGSDIALFLISIDFIDSAYCYDVEMERALELQAEGKLVVIPVILRACLWQHTPLSKLLALPSDGRAVTMWGNRDEALSNIAEGVLRKASEILENR